MHTAPLPSLRPVDIRHHEQNGHPYLLLRDPLQLSDRILLVPQPLAAALAFLNGRRNAEQVAAALESHYRIPVRAGQIMELVQALDNALLLDNERARAAQAELLRAYRSAPHRPPLLAGRGYPGEPGALHALLQEYLEAAGVLPRAMESFPGWTGLLSPHIDYARGGSVYAQVWKRAAEAAKAADLVILFGTDHYGDDPFTLTRQHYATPYGVLPTHTGMVDALAQVLGEEAAFAGELRHRDEHSLELVAVWLHHMRAGQPCPVVPILTGSLNRFMGNGARPAEEPLLQRVLETIHAQAAGQRVLVVASGDLAHVGPEFGGTPLDDTAREALQRADAELIEHMTRGDQEGFFGAIRRIRNGNNVCGVSPIYLSMQVLEKAMGRTISGEHLGYTSCPADNQDTSAVTVCGVLFS